MNFRGAHVPPVLRLAPSPSAPLNRGIGMLVFSKLFGESAEKYTRDACAPQKIARTREILIESFRVSACTIPTETPEADGTYEWDSTTVVIAEVSGDGKE